MPLFVYIGRDGSRGTELRKTVRERHIAHMEILEREGRIRFAGPVRDESGAPRGSVIVIEARDLADATAVAHGDPYHTEGVFESVEIGETIQVFPKASVEASQP